MDDELQYFVKKTEHAIDVMVTTKQDFDKLKM